MRVLARLPVFGLVIFVTLDLAAGQSNEPARVFKTALEEIRQTKIPILLPSSLPATIEEPDIKLAWGTASDDGYSVSLYYEKMGSDAAFAAGFEGSRKLFRDVPNTRRVQLANGAMGMFRPVSCGGSCAPANLWWKHRGVMYRIQIKLGSTMSEKEQERILVGTANSMVVVPKQ